MDFWVWIEAVLENLQFHFGNRGMKPEPALAGGVTATGRLLLRQVVR
jgi:hypothetical protein